MFAATQTEYVVSRWCLVSPVSPWCHTVLLLPVLVPVVVVGRAGSCHGRCGAPPVPGHGKGGIQKFLLNRLVE